MHLFDGDQLIRTYPIDLGFDPIGPKRREGDGRTPEGSFQIITKNPDSRFHRFLGIDYPNEDAVAYGLQHGMISLGEAASIRHANASVRRPDWTTALGGGLGIHGFARGADWTAGCIALADDSVTELFDVLRIGDPVEILP
jgi:murein L,D-transpeptidase YafK